MIHKSVIITAAAVMLAASGCALERECRLPDRVREDKARLEQGLPLKHYRSKHQLRAAERGFKAHCREEYQLRIKKSPFGEITIK
ncbi:MAG: hypothetical protein KY476_20330 [Planctomycetes bacterium]|nr:hypothetical protein [Planctomycetota bacterium]